MYELKKLSRVYPKARGKVAALSGVDLQIPDGEFITVQGLTGHGKTTLLQMLGALDKPTSGKVIFDGMDLGAMPESQLVDVRAQNFGFIFQNYNLLPTLNAEENVEAALVPLRIKSAERRARSLAALAEVGLADRATHFPPEMFARQFGLVLIRRLNECWYCLHLRNGIEAKGNELAGNTLAFDLFLLGRVGPIIAELLGQVQEHRDQGLGLIDSDVVPLGQGGHFREQLVGVGWGFDGHGEERTWCLLLQVLNNWGRITVMFTIGQEDTRRSCRQLARLQGADK